MPTFQRSNPFDLGPVATGMLLAVAAQLLFGWQLGRPSILVFDETHYVPAARHLLLLDLPFNTEHPLFGKSLIALGIRLFGDHAIGWRALSSVAGTATVAGVYAIGWLLWRRPRPALFAGLFALTNVTVFVQARIAMLDGFMVALLMWGIAALLWAMQSSPERVRGRWIAGAALLGLAVGVKWAAVPYVALAGLGLLVVRWRERRRAGRTPPMSRHWPGLATVPALALLGLVSGGTYLLTFAPAFFYAQDPLTPARLIPFQFEMLALQRQVLPSHTYQSDWWSWPLMIRPIWYLYEPVDGAQRGILMLGNPAIVWGGLVACATLLWAGWRANSLRLAAPALLWAGAYLPFAIIPKSLGFYYYYYPATVFLPLALAGAFAHRQKGRDWDIAWLVLSVGLFSYFYPIIAAGALPGPGGFHRWMWFRSWA